MYMFIISALFCALVLVAVPGNNGEVYLETAIASISAKYTLTKLNATKYNSSC